MLKNFAMFLWMKFSNFRTKCFMDWWFLPCVNFSKTAGHSSAMVGFQFSFNPAGNAVVAI